MEENTTEKKKIGRPRKATRKAANNHNKSIGKKNTEIKQTVRSVRKKQKSTKPLDIKTTSELESAPMGSTIIPVQEPLTYVIPDDTDVEENEKEIVFIESTTTESATNAKKQIEDALFYTICKSPPMFRPSSGLKTYQRSKPRFQRLSFDSCDNRDEILKWLNDRRNVFDRRTLTQSQPRNGANNDNDADSSILETTDSVSQAAKKQRRENQEAQKNIIVTRQLSRSLSTPKNLTKRPRILRLSLDARLAPQNEPCDENYKYELDEEAETKFIVNLMEDQYLECVAAQDLSPNLHHQNVQQVDAENCIVDYDVFEAFFEQKILQDENATINIAKNLIQQLNRLMSGPSGSLISGMVKKQLSVPLVDRFTQTKCEDEFNGCHVPRHIMNSEPQNDAGIQCKILADREIGTQTELNSVDCETQTDFQRNFEKETQCELLACFDAVVQTSELFQDQITVKNSPASVVSDDIFDEMNDSLDFAGFVTKEYLQKETENNGEKIEETDEKIKEKKEEANRKVAKKDEEEKICGKRVREDSQNENCKRPCLKFLQNDISVNFDSDEEKKEEKSEPKLEVKKDSQEIIGECVWLIDNTRKMLDLDLKQTEINNNIVEKVEDVNVVAKQQSFRRNLFNVDQEENKEKNEEVMNLSGSSDKENFNDENSSKTSKTDIKILQHILLEPLAQQNNGNIEDDGSETDDDLYGDLIECTPQKKSTELPSRIRNTRNITITPPVEFQDPINANNENSNSKKFTFKPINSIPKTSTQPKQNSVLMPVLRGSSFQVQSTPHSLKTNAKFPSLNLSPIAFGSQMPRSIIKTPSSSIRSLKTNGSQQRGYSQYLSPASQKQTSIMLYIGSQELGAKKQVVVSSSRLDDHQGFIINQLVKKQIIMYSPDFNNQVTHLIVAVNSKNHIINHTIKFLYAVAAGIWVLNFDWIEECLVKNCLVPEEKYEVLDITGMEGPKSSRMYCTSKPLLKGYQIYLAPPFETLNITDLERAVRQLGGTIAEKVENLDKSRFVCVILTEAKCTQDYDNYDIWLNNLGVITLDFEWLTISVGQYKLENFIPYTLCIDDSITNLGYPTELVSGHNGPSQYRVSPASRSFL